MEKIKKIFALVLCVVLLLSVLFSVSFVSHGTSHDCGGEDCQICAVIHKCAEVLENLLAAASFTALFGIAVFAVFRIAEVSDHSSVSVTPVRLKVKLSN